MKDKKTALRLDKKIYAVFFAVIFIALCNAVISGYTITKNKRITKNINEVINPSLEGLHEMNALVTKSRIFITNWVFQQKARPKKEDLDEIFKVRYPDVKDRLTQLAESWGNQQQPVKLKEAFKSYEQLMLVSHHIMSELSTFDDYQDAMKKFAAEELIESEITPRSQSLLESLEQITSAKKEESAAAQAEMDRSLAIMLLVILGFALAIMISILSATLFLSRLILSPVMKLREIILQMSRGELPEMRLKIPSNAVGETIMALGQLIDGLRRTSLFAREIGNGNFSSAFVPLSENDVQGKALIEMRDRLSEAHDADANRNWINAGLAQVNQVIQNHSDNLVSLTEELSKMIVDYTGVYQAAFFLTENHRHNKMEIRLVSGYALNRKLIESSEQELQDGLIGQAVRSNKKIMLTGVKDPAFTAHTGLVHSEECCITIFPLLARGKVMGAVEVASVKELPVLKQKFLQLITEPVAMGLDTVRANALTKHLLEESIKQADALNAQKQELHWANEELIRKSKELELSQNELRSQQDDLKQMNLELEMKAHLLQEQNMAIEEARQSLAFKAKQLEQSSKYKSAFLANMSHELRTPLNSVLILAKMLSENKLGNLNEKQVEHAQVIYKSGHDLLLLINDILDLSKIEAGKIELTVEEVASRDVADGMNSLFNVLAAEKGIRFQIEMDAAFPGTIKTDRMRLEQIIKNLLSNAFKFTPKDGSVSLQFGIAPKDAIFKNEKLYQSDKILCIAVTDTGIGIPEDKQRLVFESFQQADGSTSRKFGGTGLGLAISRELSLLLGGDLILHSIEGSGSTFSIYLPHTIAAADASAVSPGKHAVDTEQSSYLSNEILDDRNNIAANDDVVVIIEDDVRFAKMLVDISHEYGLKAVVAVQGDTALNYIRKFNPSKIILDMQLPVVDGWSILKSLKEDVSLRNIPVYIISAMDKSALGYKMGAAGYITKPVRKEDITKIFGEAETKAVPAVKQNAYEHQFSQSSGVSGSAVAEALGITNTGITNNDVVQPGALAGKKVLLTDDDMRNIYSLNAILEGEGMEVLVAHDGREAISRLSENPGIDIVLMDIMMPNMDGYEAMAVIRKEEKFTGLPIIALTAKAMKEDRQKCLDSGATDYLTKPVNVNQLLTMMQVLLFKQ